MVYLTAAVIYYAPTIFTQLGLTGNTSSLLATGVVGIVNFVFTIPAVLWVDVVGRRPGMIAGAANMAISHATIGAIIAVFGDRFDTDKAPGRGAIFMVYYFIVWFAITWGPMAWIVSSEVWPLQYRSRGMGISSATNWLNNFAVAISTPVMIANIGYKTYMVFMTTCLVGMVWAIFLLPELKGLSLEQIDDIFGDKTGAEDVARRKRVAAEVGLDDAERRLSVAGEKGADDPAYRRSDVEATAPLTATAQPPLETRFSSGTAYTTDNEKEHHDHEPVVRHL
jgi:MFS family permease